MKSDGEIFICKEDLDFAEAMSREYPLYQTQVFTAVLSAVLIRRSGTIPSFRTQDAVRTPKPMTTTEFFARLKPSQDVDKVLGAAYYLERYRNAEDFTAEELKGCILQGKVKAPANISLAVLRNAQKGLMAEIGKREGGRKSWILTQTGAEAVEQLLSLVKGGDKETNGNGGTRKP